MRGRRVCGNTRVVTSPGPKRLVGSISNLQLIAHFNSLEKLGVDVGRVLERLGWSRESFADPNGRCPASIAIPMWQVTREVSGDPAIGLRSGERIWFDSLGGYGYMLSHSATHRELLERADKFIRLVDDLCRIETHELGDRALLRLTCRGDYPIADEAVDCLFAAIVTWIQTCFSSEQCSLMTVRFEHPPRMERERYEEMLGCPVELDSEQNELEFPSAWLDEAVPRADPKLGLVLQEHATHLLDELPEADSFLHDVRAQLTTRLSQNDAGGLPALARALAMSERTLRRRLAEHGTSYQLLLDELRSKLARKLVEQGSEPFDVIAEQVGFSDTSSFFHAFKRWTGTPPAQYRRTRRGKA